MSWPLGIAALLNFRGGFPLLCSGSALSLSLFETHLEGPTNSTYRISPSHKGVLFFRDWFLGPTWRNGHFGRTLNFPFLFRSSFPFKWVLAAGTITLMFWFKAYLDFKSNLSQFDEYNETFPKQLIHVSPIEIELNKMWSLPSKSSQNSERDWHVSKCNAAWRRAKNQVSGMGVEKGSIRVGF